MSWPLTTTGDGDLLKLVREVASLRHPRKFLWTHCSSKIEMEIHAKSCKVGGLVVLPQVPCWFLLACAKHVQKRTRLKMMQSITLSAGTDCYWRGVMFGYHAKDIEWFQREINLAMARVKEYQRSL